MPLLCFLCASVFRNLPSPRPAPTVCVPLPAPTSPGTLISSADLKHRGAEETEDLGVLRASAFLTFAAIRR